MVHIHSVAIKPKTYLWFHCITNPFYQFLRTGGSSNLFLWETFPQLITTLAAQAVVRIHNLWMEMGHIMNCNYNHNG